MIISASRRTDIPNYYSSWFLNRIREGFVLVRNPVNPHQVSRISLAPEAVDCIVFWTKNPEPMLERLGELKEYPFYFQFTLTPYGRDVEENVPHKKDRMIPVFKRLSQMIGGERVVWRYDPILFSGRYTPQYHLQAFKQIAEALRGYTDQCVISFVDTYAKNRKELQALGIYDLPEEELAEFAGKLGQMAAENGMEIGSCAERMDLAPYGICHNSCVDQKKIEKILGCSIRAAKDRNQREACGCIESIDIGAYNTCQNGCRYCYANAGAGAAALKRREYDPDSPLLCSHILEGDRITDRKVKSLKEEQLSLAGIEE